MLCKKKKKKALNNNKIYLYSTYYILMLSVVTNFNSHYSQKTKVTNIKQYTNDMKNLISRHLTLFLFHLVYHTSSTDRFITKRSRKHNIKTRI